MKKSEGAKDIEKFGFKNMQSLFPEWNGTNA